MLIFMVRRFGTMALTMLVVSILVFLLLEINVESVATKVLGPYTSQEQRELWLERNGYTDPAIWRYLRWLGNFVVGDFGDSVRFKVPVSDVLWPRLANTAILGGIALFIASIIGLTLGVIAGMREGGARDRGVSVGAVLTTSVPEFASAVFLSGLLVFTWPVLPGTSGMADGFDLVQLVLPVMVLVIYDWGYVARMTRASMAEVMMTHYIRTAVLKGLPYGQVIRKHALRNALIAPFTVIMLQINWLLSGVIVVEVAFAYKGFGSLLYEASLNSDIYLIEACAMVAVFVAVMTQTLADIGYTYLNPRIRFS
ncbi:ABC transporter permease [Pelagibius marinus]|uniref:ABC transporter permease n=1 Tax=Pelagibius marinus TaxID=2762760 RepID=UPI001872572E|nr:ABC transporter permease [Pelagibius marinus]